jgi:EpsI family protein
VIPVRREFWISVVVLLAGIVLLNYTATAEVRVPRDPLDLLPRVVDGREGYDRPIAARILETLAVTDHVSRVYRAPGRLPVDLYIGFYGSQRTGATYHSPRNCMPGSGWQFLESATVRVAGPDGRPVTVNDILIGKGTERLVTYYWYQDRGRVIADEYEARLMLVWDAATRHRTDGSLVRVIVRADGDIEAARREARAFTERLMPMLPEFLPN